MILFYQLHFFTYKFIKWLLPSLFQILLLAQLSDENTMLKPDDVVRVNKNLTQDFKVELLKGLSVLEICLVSYTIISSICNLFILVFLMINSLLKKSFYINLSIVSLFNIYWLSITSMYNTHPHGFFSK